MAMSRSYFSSSMGRPDFSIVASIARLSHKYQIEILLQSATNLLERAFPIEFEIWIENQGFKRAPLLFNPTQAIEAVNLIHLLGRTDMLPMAIYQCSLLDGAPIVRGTRRVDGTLEKLAPEDMERCIRAWKYCLACPQIFLDELFAPSETCERPHKCGPIFMEAAHARLRREGSGLLRGDPLCYIESDTLPRVGSLCPSCVTHRGRGRLLELQQQAWDLFMQTLQHISP